MGKKSGFQFIKPIVRNINYNLSDDFDNTQETFFDNHFNTLIRRIPDKNEAIVELSIVVGDHEKSKNVPFTLQMTIGAYFRWEENIGEEIVQDLLKMNAPALLLSYARPIISNITANSSIPYDIPFMDFTETVKDK